MAQEDKTAQDDLRKQQWKHFLARLGEYAWQVAIGQAKPERLRTWLERAVDKWQLPLDGPAIEAVMAAVDGASCPTKKT